MKSYTCKMAVKGGPWKWFEAEGTHRERLVAEERCRFRPQEVG